MNIMNTSTNNTPVCANCGKGEEAGINLKTCTACHMVKYCSRECQIAHRPQHKKQCKRRAKELHDEKLFKQPPPMEDCPICMERLPTLASGRTYMPCCGKVICCGCVYAFQSRATKKEHDVCPFCRTPPQKSDEKKIKQYEKRMDTNDPIAIKGIGSMYRDGDYGLPRDQAKALELWHRAGELGSADAYYNIGIAYGTGDGVEVDEKKAVHYYVLGAMGGSVDARHNLGASEGRAGNYNRALKHFMIAVKDGGSTSMENIKRMYETGLLTKDDYAKALRGYQAYLDEIKTNQRDEAVAVWDDYKYYSSV